jgi:hypothetical protein
MESGGCTSSQHRLTPVILGEGTRLFDCSDFGQVGLEVVDTVSSPRVTT